MTCRPQWNGRFPRGSQGGMYLDEVTSAIALPLFFISSYVVRVNGALPPFIWQVEHLLIMIEHAFRLVSPLDLVIVEEVSLFSLEQPRAASVTTMTVICLTKSILSIHPEIS